MKKQSALNLIFSLTFSLASKDQSRFIENLNLNFTLKNDQAFPDKFRVKFSEFGENFDFEFVKSTAHRGTDNVYVISNGQPTEYTFKSADLYEKYEQISGDGWATLTRYKILNNQLRFIGTVYSTRSQNFAFDIYPVFTNGSSNYTSDSNKHQIKKRSVNSDYSSQNLDYIISPETFAKINNTIRFLFQKWSSSRKKTGRVGLDGQPINLYVELLVVTDSSVYDYHRRFIGTDDQSLIFSQMRIYYAHLINGINQRYTNSLMNDPDLKIFIVLKNYLFLTNPADQTWLDVENVGDSNFSTYEGKEVVITDKTLTAFTNFMNSKTFQFTYDHAVALFNKDLWSNDLTAAPANRKGVAGFATIGQVCQTNKYSISEDSGGFANSIVIAHELGHNLGSLHDGEVGCDDSLNFIMTPVLNSNPPQTNFYLFSDCSINQFKSVLLNDQLNDVSSTASCLTNIPTSFPAELSLVSLTYPGLIWTANDQCKMQYGPQSSSCPLLINSGSCALFCYPNTTSLSCLSVPGGAVDGTACDVGKICINGECVLDQKASNNTCLFGDTIMPTNVLVGYQLGLTVNQINCSELFRLGELANHGVDAYCSDPRISTSCCQSCRKYKILTCKDNFYDCARYSTLCDNALLNGSPIWQSCLRSCNRCPNINSVQRCNESISLCQNGGTCRNTTVSGAIGFECVCLLGYSGQFCETKNPCLSNPCLNGGTCNLLGSSGYTCSCLGICSSFNCEGCANPISTTTTATTTTTANLHSMPKWCYLSKLGWWLCLRLPTRLHRAIM
ncbi:A disintegrin and metallo ase with thrombospondin motifs 3-like [Brachionus plicatilis]|uniref:A disintegrin and metallo ase with thrombospondin motifs 3-like n=1 Tax=Brachionus plicatilis TaxID=10195 RepID=A0A3M7QNB3_BRAPC|nr:A disintegrin and metallo ase with thrombospondin motifs 3-like [Brachionus plicatilis]